MSMQLKWSRSINVHGHAGKNIPADLHMEHLNRVCRGAISGLGANGQFHSTSGEVHWANTIDTTPV